MNKSYALADVIALLCIPIFAIIALVNAFSGNTLHAILYGILAAIFAILEGISMLIDKIELYHEETRLLRKDLASLNIEISNAFDNVDKNFAALVHAIDDFAAELEEGERII